MTWIEHFKELNSPELNWISLIMSHLASKYNWSLTYCPTLWFNLIITGRAYSNILSRIKSNLTGWFWYRFPPTLKYTSAILNTRTSFEKKLLQYRITEVKFRTFSNLNVIWRGPRNSKESFFHPTHSYLKHREKNTFCGNILLDELYNAKLKDIYLRLYATIERHFLRLFPFSGLDLHPNTKTNFLQTSSQQNVFVKHWCPMSSISKLLGQK